jgi:hypothetical protein
MIRTAPRPSVRRVLALTVAPPGVYNLLSVDGAFFVWRCSPPRLRESNLQMNGTACRKIP